MAKFRQGAIHRPFRAVVFTEAGTVDFPTEFPGGVVFRMVKGTRVITGTAVGDAIGNVTYQWGASDLNDAGTYAAVLIGTDVNGRTEDFPTGSNLEIVVVPAL